MLSKRVFATYADSDFLEFYDEKYQNNKPFCIGAETLIAWIVTQRDNRPNIVNYQDLTIERTGWYLTVNNRETFNTDNNSDYLELGRLIKSRYNSCGKDVTNEIREKLKVGKLLSDIEPIPFQTKEIYILTKDYKNFTSPYSVDITNTVVVFYGDPYSQFVGSVKIPCYIYSLRFYYDYIDFAHHHLKLLFRDHNKDKLFRLYGSTDIETIKSNLSEQIKCGNLQFWVDLAEKINQ